MAARLGSAMTAILCAGTALAAAPGDWPTFGGEPGGTRYSALNQITPANVSQLQQAWVYHMKPAGTPAPAAPSAAELAQARAEQAGPPPGAGNRPPPGAGGGRGGGPFGRGGRFTPSESVPLVINGTMYLGTPYGRIVALDPKTGSEKWVFALPEGSQVAMRGIEYWPGSGKVPPALVFGTRDGKLMSIGLTDGKPTPGFGTNGIVDLKTPDVMVTGPEKTYGMSSPPIIYKNLIITGSAVGEGIGGAVGDVRAWAASTGKLVWTFHSVPRPGEPNDGTWANDSGHNRSGVNVWGMMTVDTKRGIVYMPFGAPANDRVGVDRPGNNLYGSSIVAADAATGKYLWHFQIVHHDIWDNDAQTPPTLFDVRHNGKTIPAVGIESKNSMVFILDRVTGKPIYPIEEQPVPKSDVPGEITSPTQPFPTMPAPLERLGMTADEISTLTPEHEAFCRKLVNDNKILLGGAYTPPTFNRPMVYFPGTVGAVFGGSFDPKLGYYIINVHALGQIQEIVPDSARGFSNSGPINGRFWDPKTRMPCQSGAWGSLVAVDVNSGRVAWRSTVGVSDNLPADKQNTGRPMAGGPTSTAGGVTFMAGTDDSRFRAFDSKTGKELWAVKLPASAHTDPITYSVGGKQYVAIVATGGSFIGSPVDSDSLIAFGLK